MINTTYGTYLDPKNDYAFRRIFGDEKREPLLRHFLNSVLKLQGSRKIQHLKILDPHQVPKVKGLKQSILDVHCVDQAGHKFIVEMQVADQKDFAQRALFYVAQAYVNQLETGRDYPDLRPVTLLSILDFSLLKGKEYVSRHLVLDEVTGEHALKDFEFAFLELPKFNKQEKELVTVQEKWAYFFKHAHSTPIRQIPKHLHDPDIEQAFGVLEEIGLDRSEIRIYQKAERDRMDFNATMALEHEKGHKKGKKEGKQEGLKQGREEGRKEGEQIGLEKGEQIGVEKAKLQIARQMRKKGLDNKTIADMTGLDPKVLQTLE